MEGVVQSRVGCGGYNYSVRATFLCVLFFPGHVETQTKKSTYIYYYWEATEAIKLCFKTSPTLINVV